MPGPAPRNQRENMVDDPKILRDVYPIPIVRNAKLISDHTLECHSR